VFELANLGSSDRHATTTPPRTTWNHFSSRMT
jgi:hypothetical protein